MLMLDYARNVVGVAARGFHAGRHVGWTTDRAKAEALAAAGCIVSFASASDPAYNGWEYSFSAGSEVAHGIA